MFVLTENPPMHKQLRKRKREELNEQRRKEVFCRDSDTYIEEPSKQDENSNTSEDDYDVSPSIKFRQGLYGFLCCKYSLT